MADWPADLRVREWPRAGDAMTLHEYLMSEQAREDVRRIIAHGEMHGKQPHRFCASPSTWHGRRNVG